jgi:hypothetical protein
VPAAAQIERVQEVREALPGDVRGAKRAPLVDAITVEIASHGGE